VGEIVQIVAPGLSPVLLAERTLFAALTPTMAKVAPFAAVAEPPSTASIVASVVQPATSVQMLVAMAATVPGGDLRTRAAARADAGLRVLAQLDSDVQNGRSRIESIQAIAAWADTPDVPDDPVIASLLMDIELRVQVELAKHEILI
jgi:hypothetical protein